MALHTELPIYKTGVDLLALALKAQQHMPRAVKRSLGDKISHYCVEMLDLMALANATRAAERAMHIQALMTRLRAMQVLMRVSVDSQYVSLSIWADSVELLEAIGRQGGGWLKSSVNPNRKAPAA